MRVRMLRQTHRAVKPQLDDGKAENGRFFEQGIIMRMALVYFRD